MQEKDFDRIQQRLGGISRRDFMKFCSAIAVSLALPEALGPKIAQAITSPNRPPVIWLHGSECTGCSMSLLRAEHPSLDPILAIQSFYVMAAGLAVARGMNPDQPRHLSKVTRTH